MGERIGGSSAIPKRMEEAIEGGQESPRGGRFEDNIERASRLKRRMSSRVVLVVVVEGMDRTKEF